MMGKYKSYSTPNALRLDLPSSIRLAAFVICSNPVLISLDWSRSIILRESG
ncbi:hypothetical protein [Methylovulum miyakonense]|uniref:hypothetical protein n=1 Tax=Methylovulum miyakonense TaxID=645578 RepID=UPI00039DB2B4|nr:hypothetical protein [Methylovulum miyakonense]